MWLISLRYVRLCQIVMVVVIKALVPKNIKIKIKIKINAGYSV
jgi:hypothetical protein